MTLKTRETRLAATQAQEANDAEFPEFAEWLTQQLRALVEAHRPKRRLPAATQTSQPATASAPRAAGSR